MSLFEITAIILLVVIVVFFWGYIATKEIQEYKENHPHEEIHKIAEIVFTIVLPLCMLIIQITSCYFKVKRIIKNKNK